MQQVARSVETHLRVTFLRKLPRLEPRYFKSRPVSDMAERAHAVHRLRDVVPLAASTWRALAEVLALSAGPRVARPAAARRWSSRWRWPACCRRSSCSSR